MNVGGAGDPISEHVNHTQPGSLDSNVPGGGETLVVESGEPRRNRHPEGSPGLDVPTGDPSPGTVIGVEVGPDRATPSMGFAPITPNEEWERIAELGWGARTTPSIWCLRRGGIVPRLHRPEHFLIFDPALLRYRRCSRCGQTIYLMRGRG